MDKVEEFIKRRFPTDCNWMTENCYYFAHILKMRFKGEIWYDLVDGHFLFRHYDKFYDWTGWREDYDMSMPETVDNLVKWFEYRFIDPKHCDRIGRDVIE